MTGHSLVPMSALAAGLPYEDLCLAILESAALEHARPAQAQNQAQTPLDPGATA
jgi:D-alanine-D-alanine ligase